MLQTPAPKRYSRWQTVIIPLFVLCLSGAVSGFFTARYLAPPPDVSPYTAREDHASAIAVNAVSTVDGDPTHGGYALAFDGSSSTSDGAQSLLFGVTLNPVADKPEFASWSYTNKGSKPVTFVNDRYRAMPESGVETPQSWVLPTKEAGYFDVSDSFLNNPADRQKIAGEHVTVGPGKSFLVVVVADPHTGTAGGSIGMETAGLTVVNGDFTQNVSVWLPKPLQVFAS